MNIRRMISASIYYLILLPASFVFGQSAVNTASTQSCNRECLFAQVDLYLAALKAKDPSLAQFADGVKFTENNVPLELGDGLWATITGMGEYDLRFADEQNGEVGFYGVVDEPDFSSLFGLRLKVANLEITEAETVVLRMVNEPKGIVWPEPVLEHKPLFYDVLPETSRRARAELVQIADGYFSTLQRNDGTLHTVFHPDCNRVENGTKTTNNPQVEFTSVGAMGCEQQFRLGNYFYDDAIRARRYPLIDEERGLVLASGFIDHAGRVGKYTLTDGREVTAPLRYPHSFYFLELFHIEGGMIRQIDAVFVTVPYGMASPWVQ
jgi:hypothetical protein